MKLGGPLVALALVLLPVMPAAADDGCATEAEWAAVHEGLTKHQVRLAVGERGTQQWRAPGYIGREYRPCDGAGFPKVAYEWDGAHWIAFNVSGNA
jgi:hypothetical protein